MNPDPDLILLLQAWSNPDISETERARLLERLAADADLRQALAEQLAMGGALRAVQAPEPRWLELQDLLDGRPLNRPPRPPEDFGEKVMARVLASGSPGESVTRWHRWLAMAAVVTLAAGVWWLSRAPDQPDDPPPATIASVIGLKAPGTPGAGGLWKPGSLLTAGPLDLTDGTLVIRTSRGVELSLRAPVRARLLSADEIEVLEGNVLAKVPAGAERFRMYGPALRVEDLGTESVSSGGTGLRPVRVFEGWTEVSGGSPMAGVPDFIPMDLPANRRHRDGTGNGGMPDDKTPSDQVVAGPSGLDLGSYPGLIRALRPSAYWRFEIAYAGRIPSELPEVPPLEVLGDAMIVPTGDANSAGELSGTARVDAFRPHFRPDMLAGDFTITCWLRPQSHNSGIVFAATRADDREREFSLMALAAAETPPVGKPGLRLHFGLKRQDAGQSPPPLVASRLIYPGHWHHLAITREGGMLRLYLDGKEAASGKGPDGNPSFTRVLVGRHSAKAGAFPTAARPFTGAFDELALFQRALAGSTIADLAKAATADTR